MQLLFIHGPAACGKLSVASEVATLSGLPLFDSGAFEFSALPEPALRLDTSAMPAVEVAAKIAALVSRAD